MAEFTAGAGSEERASRPLCAPGAFDPGAASNLRVEKSEIRGKVELKRIDETLTSQEDRLVVTFVIAHWSHLHCC